LNLELTSQGGLASGQQSIYSDKDNAIYRRKKLQKFLDDIIYNMLNIPTAFFMTEIKYPFLCNLFKACVKYEMPQYIESIFNHNITAAIQRVSVSYADMISDNNVSLKRSPFPDAQLEDSQKRYLETIFPWSFILFIEYITFNPQQYHRERLCEIISKQKILQADLEAATQSKSGSKRRYLTCTNRLRLQKEKFDAWQKAESNATIPIYPLAAILRFACCERSNAKLAEDDELIEEGTDFVISKAVINALSTVFKYPQFASRILINTPKLLHIVNEITYKEFKSIYSDIFRYDAKYQEKPQMYELFKTKWIKYGKEIKILLDVYHEEYQKVHREAVWKSKELDFPQLHASIYPKDKNSLFTYCSNQHFQQMQEKYHLKIADQEQHFLHDVLQVFKMFGYADDSQHRFYGNYYREFVEKEENEEEEDDDDEEEEEEEEEEHPQDADDEHDEDAQAAEAAKQKRKTGDDDTEHPKQHEEQEEESYDEDDDDEKDKDDEDEEDEDEKPRRRNSTVDQEERALAADEHEDNMPAAPHEATPEELESKPRHRKQDTLTQETTQFAQMHEFDVEQIGRNNPLQSKYEDSSDEEVNLQHPPAQNNALDVNQSADLDDFDDLNDDNEIEANKARGSNEFDADEVKEINNIKPGGAAGTDSPLQNIQENTNIDARDQDHVEEEEEEEDHGNPFGLPVDDEEEEEDVEQKKEDEQTPPKHQEYQQQQDQHQQQGSGQNGFAAHEHDGDDGGDNNNGDDYHDDNAGQNGFGGGAGGAGGGRDRDDDDKEKDKRDDRKKKQSKDKAQQEEEEEEDEDEEQDVEDLDERQGTTPIVDVEEEEEDENGGFEEDDELKVNVGNTLRHMTKKSKRHGFLVEDKDGDGDENNEEEDEDADVDEFRANKEWATTLLNNPNITGMQSREAMLNRIEEQQDLYQRHQNQRLQEEEQEDMYSILDLDNTGFIDACLGDGTGQIDEQHNAQEFGWQTANVLVPDLSGDDVEDVDEDVNAAEMKEVVDENRFIDTTEAFSDEAFFKIRNDRWQVGRTDPISAIPREVAENSYVMLKDLTEPLQLSDLLGDFQKAGQIMLSRIDDMQASLIVENKLHSGVLKAHQLDEKKCYEEKEELLNEIEKLEAELKLLRDKRDENKAETAVLKTKQESYILKYNELKEVSTQKLRDQLRCFEIFKAQTTQLEKRIHSVEYQTEIAYKRYQRLLSFKKQQQLNIAQLDVEIESMEKEKEYLQQQLANLEEEQVMIDENERVYVERLKEQLRRLGKGMENKEKSCNIFRRNVVEERLRIHKIDDSLKKLRTNANPTTASDQELINATQHEALQAREKFAERTQQGSFFTNIHDHEKHLIESIEKVQSLDDKIYAKKWNIIQKSWNLKKTLLETANLNQMRKFLAKKEKQAKKHKKRLSKAQFRKVSSQNLSQGAAMQFRNKSQDFGAP